VRIFLSKVLFPRFNLLIEFVIKTIMFKHQSCWTNYRDTLNAFNWNIQTLFVRNSQIGIEIINYKMIVSFHQKIITSKWRFNRHVVISAMIDVRLNQYNLLRSEKLRKKIYSLWRGQDVLFLKIEIVDFQIQIILYIINFFPRFRII
jgi:hypothetical protein